MPVAVSTDPEWLQTLKRDGYVVVKNVIPREKALAYAAKAHKWVEDLGFGYDRNDRSTRTEDKIHWGVYGGQCNRYGVGHEQWVWDIRLEPSLIDVFAKIWGTEELLVSYDGVNINLPINGRSPDDPIYGQLPHVDQSPLNNSFHCVQGIVNLWPNGPNDGGLSVLKGSAQVYTQLFEAFEDVKPPGGWNKRDRHNHTKEQMQWLYDHGCEWEKVCSEPGDLLLWESRMVHFGAAPRPNAVNDRIATYVCYKPANLLGDYGRAFRKDAWERKLGTTHDPITGNISGTGRVVPKDHHSHEFSKRLPLQQPVLNKRGRQLAGLEAY